MIRVVEASELALDAGLAQAAELTEIGDAMSHMDSAFKSLKNVSKTMEGFVPALDATSAEHQQHSDGDDGADGPDLARHQRSTSGRRTPRSSSSRQGSSPTSRPSS